MLALLEAVQLYGTSWTQVAQHVGSKSQVCTETPSAEQNRHIKAPDAVLCDARATPPSGLACACTL